LPREEPADARFLERVHPEPTACLATLADELECALARETADVMSEICASEDTAVTRPQHQHWRRHQHDAERPQRTKSASRIATTHTSGSAGVNGLASCRKGSFAGQGFTFTAICRYKHVTTPKARSCVPNVSASLAFTQLDRKIHYDLFHGGKSI
jgi:hypothetical protein